MSLEKHVIITVHGIRTFGQWQRRFEKLFPSSDLQFYHFEYGYFSLIAFIIPFTRWILVRRFRREIRTVVDRVRPTRLDLVGHSFGTHLIAWALRGLRPNEAVNAHTVILAGSVLRSDFYWADLIPARIVRVINDCGARDSILLASQFFVLFTGMAGRVGFVGMNGPEFANRYSIFGHSGYFQDAKGKPSDAYMLKHWVPLIEGERAIDQFDERGAPTPWRGLVIWLTNNFEPIKLMVITTPLVAGLIWIGALYLETNATKDRLAAVVALGEAMKEKQDLPVEAEPLLTTMQRALAVPLRTTAVLWVDDDPAANVLEQIALQRFGLCFAGVDTTAGALKLLEANPRKFSVVISDFRRDRDPQAGYGLLDELKKRRLFIPFIFYVSNFTSAQALEAKARGAQAEVRGVIDLWTEVFKAINPRNAPIGKLELIWQQLLGCGGT
jgi:hypothetical protein